MELLNKIFGKSVKEQEPQSSRDNEPEHAVIVRFQYGIEGLQALHDLEDKLEQIISQSTL